MGFFDRFKKKEEVPANDVQNAKQESLITTHSYRGKDGLDYLECEYYDSQADFKKFYDTTKLVICTIPEILPSRKRVYQAKVAHYSQNDAVYFGKDGEDISRRNQYTDIRLEMNFEKLLTDPEYQKILMNGLLDKKRVERYIGAGLQDYPTDAHPCGNYIGFVDINQRTGKYGKIFDPKIGEEVHNLPEMVQIREKYKQMKEQAKQSKIANLEAERDRLNKLIAEEKEK